MLPHPSDIAQDAFRSNSKTCASFVRTLAGVDELLEQVNNQLQPATGGPNGTYSNATAVLVKEVFAQAVQQTSGIVYALNRMCVWLVLSAFYLHTLCFCV